MSEQTRRQLIDAIIRIAKLDTGLNAMAMDRLEAMSDEEIRQVHRALNLVKTEAGAHIGLLTQRSALQRRQQQLEAGNFDKNWERLVHGVKEKEPVRMKGPGWDKIEEN